MANLDLKNTAIYRAVLLDKIPFFRFSGFIRDAFLTISLVLGVLGVLERFLLPVLEFPFFPYALLSFILFLFFLEVKLFFESHLKKPRLLLEIKDVEEEGNVNIGEFLDFESAKILDDASKTRGADSYALLLSLLRHSRDMEFTLSRALISRQRVREELERSLEKEEAWEEEYSQSFHETMQEAFKIAKERGNERVTPEDIFVAIGEHNSYLKSFFREEGLKREDILELTSWQLRLKRERERSPLSYGNLIKKGKLGIEWASSHTPLVDRFSVDWTKKMRTSGLPETIGHREEMEAIERILAREEMNSCFLVGEPGSGRRSVIRGVARKSFLGKSLSEVNYKRFLELDLSSVVSRAEGVEETEKILDHIFKEVAGAGNVVLIIDDIHNFVGEAKKPGIVDISSLLSSYLHLSSFKVVGITSYKGFREHAERDLTVSSLMEKVEVRETGKDETMLLLEKEALHLEKKHDKFIPFIALKRLVSLSDRYIKDHPFPEKAMELLEEAMAHLEQKGEGILLPKHVDGIVSERTEVPVGEKDEKEKEILLNMEDLLHERIVNQEQAVKAASAALRRSGAEVNTRKALIGSFLFLGPTGSGKTEMAKAISEVYFGSEERIVRMDMSEFQTSEDVSKLIGSPNERGALTARVREDPFSLILLDEIEKAHPDVLNLFLQVLDEGHITDGLGRKVDFENSMVIATSNAGYQMILDAIGKEEEWKELKDRIIKKLFRDSIFRPEFVNRFDEVVLFKPLGKDELLKVAELQLGELKRDLDRKEINFRITDELKKRIVEMSYDPVFGAREMQRVIQDNIGDNLSSVILKGELDPGDSFVVDPEDFSVKKI